MTAELDQIAATGAPARSWKPYPAYKDSGVEWLGKVPERWEVSTIKRIVANHMQGYYTNQDYVSDGVKLLRITDIDDFSNINLSECPFVSVNEKEISDFGLEINDFLFARSGTIGRFGIIRKKEKAVFASYLIRFRFSNKLDANFLKYYFFSGYFKQSLISDLHGGANQNIHAENIKNQIITIPSYPEQRAISLYLDDRTQKIDSLIEKKQEMIGLLKEERAAVINQAVTKGLNPDAPMKDSGIEWLGEIPKHWKIKRMKYVAEIKSSNVDKKSSDTEIKVFLCNYLDVYKNEYIDNSFSFMEATANENEIAKFIVKKGDVLVTKDSETPDDIANPAYIKEDLINTICGYHLAQIKANQIELIGEYLFRLFQSKQFNSHFEVSANGITRFGLSIDSFKLVLIPLPPIEEQNQIAKYIETSTQKIDTTISRIEKEIALMQEYRTALISEVVTGKVDVREAI